MKRPLWVIAILATFFTNVAIAQNLVAVKQFWSVDRNDNFLTATAIGEKSALEAGYKFVRDEGFASTVPGEGLKPLTLLYNNKNDNFTTGSSDRIQHAVSNGYRNVRVECYVWQNPGEGLIPLKLFWNPIRVDNFTTTSAKGEADAYAAGYIFAGIEGYVRKSANCNPPVAKEVWVAENGQMVTDVHVGRDYGFAIKGDNVDNFEVMINNTISYAYKLEKVNELARFNIHFSSRLGQVTNIQLRNKCSGAIIEAKLWQAVNVIN